MVGLATLGIGSGCQFGAKATMPTFPAPETLRQPVAGTQDAFDRYGLAAQEIQQSLPNLITATKFYETQRVTAMTKGAKAISMVRGATQLKCTWDYSAQGSIGSPELVGRRAAWRLIGRIFTWRITDAITNGKLDEAQALSIDGMKFAFDLMGGDAIDLDLGSTMADEIRVASMPLLNRLTVSQLWKYVGGLKAVLTRSPSLKPTIENEGKNQSVSLGLLASQVEKDDWKTIEKTFLPDGDTIAQYLKSNKGGDKNAAFFAGLEAERQERIKQALENADKGASKRKLKEFDDKRVWRKVAAHYLGTWTPMFNKYDRTVARTRLLIIATMLERTRLLDQNAPASITKFSESVRTDPFSGSDFGFLPDGRFTRVYSVGADGQDNGGETDQSGLAPDLVLEPIP